MELQAITKKANKNLENAIELLSPKVNKKGYLEVSKDRDAGPINLYYEVYGTGPKKIFFVMGLHGTHLMWALQASYFSSIEEYQVCIFDNRGIGNSTYNIGLLTTKALAKDALELLDHLNWKKDVTLVGLSLGGMIVQKMALLSPGLFSNLVLSSTYSSSLAATPTKNDCLIMLNYLYSTDLNKVLIKSCFPKTYLNQIEDEKFSNYEQLKMALLRVEKKCPKQTFTSQMAQLSSALSHFIFPEDFQLYKAHNINTIVIHGSKDKIIPIANGIRLAKNLDCQLAVFKNSGHIINIEKSDEFNNIIRSFVEKDNFNRVKVKDENVLFYRSLEPDEDQESSKCSKKSNSTLSVFSTIRKYLAIEISVVDTISERNRDLLSRLSVDKVQSVLR